MLLVGGWVVVVGLRYSDLPTDQFPLPGNIRTQEEELVRLQKDIEVLRLERGNRERAFTKLRTQASPFWQIRGKTPHVEVPAEFTKLARQAQVKVQTVGAPRSNKLLDLAHIREVEFSVRVTSSMREVSRLLDQVDRADHELHWKSLSLRPDNRTAPKAVVLNGRVRALVLSADAADFLAEGEEEK